MPLSQHEIALIRKTHALLLPKVEEASVAFYERLFEKSPRIRELFRDDISNQGMKFMTAIGYIVDQLDRPEQLEERLTRLGRGHTALGIDAEDFGPMGEALIETLAATVGPEFSPEAEIAWRKAYGEISAGMIVAAGMGAATG